MEMNLECLLGNKATFTGWLEQMWKYFKVKEADKDKKGWSKRSFSRRLDTLKEKGRVTGGGNQGDFYSVAHTPEADRARHADTTQTPASGVSQTDVSQVVPGPPLKGGGTCGTAFEAPQEVPNQCHGHQWHRFSPRLQK
jgi:hypothetical protein